MNHAQVNTSWKVTIVADLSAERRAFEEAEVNRRMNLGALVTCFIPLLHNRLSRQLGQLSTPPTLFSLCSPFLPSSSALSLFVSLSLPLSWVSTRSFLSRAPLSLFYSNPIFLFLPSFFWQPPSSVLSVACPFSLNLFPCVTYSLSKLGVIERNWRTNNYESKACALRLIQYSVSFDRSFLELNDA